MLAHRKRPRLAVVAAAGVAALLLLLVAAALFVDEPLRQYMERTLNADLQGYTVRLPELSLNPFSLALTLKGLTIAQTAHPAPAVAEFPYLHASVHWRALLRLRLVADFLLRDPRIHVNLAQLRHEAADKVPLKDKGWQQALEAIYPLKINRFRVKNGDLTYIDDDPKRPLHISQLNLLAENIRNVRAPDRVYPSEVHADGVVFDSGTMRLDGQANFLAQPFAGIDADVALERVDLTYFKPILARTNLWITGGSLWADGHVEYAPEVKNVHLRQVAIHKVRLDYVHSAQTATEEKERAAKVGEVAAEVSHAPAAVVRIEKVHLADSEVGYVDESANPRYRVFLLNSDLTIGNLSNRVEDGRTTVALKGKFMGSGDTVLDASLQPAAPSADFTTALKVENTDLRAMNDLLRSFANFDVVAGQFSLYTELTVKHGEVSGYVKPILHDMNVYSPPQDADKPLLHQAYEELIGALQTILQNHAREVGAKVEISGPASQPQTRTIDVLLGLFKNAFIKAITHGFEPQHDGSD